MALICGHKSHKLRLHLATSYEKCNDQTHLRLRFKGCPGAPIGQPRSRRLRRSLPLGRVRRMRGQEPQRDLCRACYRSRQIRAAGPPEVNNRK